MSQNNEPAMGLYDHIYTYLHETWDPIGLRPLEKTKNMLPTQMILS
jgi:hypothetical protein